MLKLPRSKIDENKTRKRKTFKSKMTVKLVIIAGPTGITIPDQWKNNTIISNWSNGWYMVFTLKNALNARDNNIC